MTDAYVNPSTWDALRARMATLGVREDDLIEKFILGSGSGGQKINKTSSCVYLKHVPSGLEVKCQASRSRDLNRLKARRDLCDRLAEKIAGERSARRQEAERVRRQKRRRSRRQKAHMLDDKRKHGEKKSLRRSVATLLAVGALGLSLSVGPAWGAEPAVIVAATATAPVPAMTWGQAVILGLVEGLTEYLPVSSTGHLLLTQRLMGLAGEGDDRIAAESYAICIQAGAILAVLGLYFGRVRAMAMGVIGRDPEGRRLALRILLAFLPAAVIGLLAEDWIKGALFGGGQWDLWPTVAAWFVGGLVILGVHRRLARYPGRGVPLASLTARMALGIGLAQCIAMWPGVSRSLATILGGVGVGLTLGAAVEFSFLLGLLTLTASTLYDALNNGGTIIATYGLLRPLVGLLVAMLSAAVAVKWMVAYLQRHGLALFGYYRIALAATVTLYLLGGSGDR